MSDNITTKHPSGRSGITMKREHYEKIKDVVMRILGEEAGININELARLTYNELKDEVTGVDLVASTKAVKNDLESRGVLTRHYRPGKHKVSLVDAE